MATVPVFDLNKGKVGSVELDDHIFSGEVKPHLINEAVRAQVAWKHAHKTANSMTRTEVSGTRKKMYRQKGTGQARHGDNKAPIFVGGGKAHGPKPRFVRHKMNKKAMRGALVSCLSLNFKEDRLLVIDKLALEKASTKKVATLLEKFALKKALFINEGKETAEKNFNLSTKNIYGVKQLKPEGVNVFDLLKFRTVIFSQNALKAFSQRLKNA